MTPGLVISIRVNPKDVMAVIDVLDYLGIPKANLSFAQATKLVLASALESFRQQGIVPNRSGFEYSKMIEPFEQQNFNSRGAKLKSAKMLRQPGVEVRPVVEETPERKKRRVRYEELLFRKRADDVNWTDADQQEFMPLVEEFFE